MALRVDEELSTTSGILLAVFGATPSILCGEYRERSAIADCQLLFIPI
jgi:hypothetical protein